MKKNIFIIILSGIIFFMPAAASQAAPKYLNDGSGKKRIPPDPIYKKTVIIPAGHTIPVITQDAVNASNFSVADRVDTFINNDFYYNKTLIAPDGSLVRGTVIKSVKADKQCDAEIKVKFTAIITPEGQNIPITGLFKTKQKNGIITGNGIRQNSRADIIIMQPITYIPVK